MKYFYREVLGVLSEASVSRAVKRWNITNEIEFVGYWLGLATTVISDLPSIIKMKESVRDVFFVGHSRGFDSATTGHHGRR
jgi:hypothetical protein